MLLDIAKNSADALPRCRLGSNGLTRIDSPAEGGMSKSSGLGEHRLMMIFTIFSSPPRVPPYLTVASPPLLSLLLCIAFGTITQILLLIVQLPPSFQCTTTNSSGLLKTQSVHFGVGVMEALRSESEVADIFPPGEITYGDHFEYLGVFTDISWDYCDVPLRPRSTNASRAWGVKVEPAGKDDLE